MPAAQSVHAEAPTAEYFPDAHRSLHAELRPVKDEYVPAPHSAHQEDPVDDAYWPALQAVQVVEPVAAAYWPAVQGAHGPPPSVPSAEKKPAAHCASLRPDPGTSSAAVENADTRTAGRAMANFIISFFLFRWLSSPRFFLQWCL